MGLSWTADGDCSHEVKRHLLFGRKVTTNLDSILKSKDIILLIKVYIVKVMGFPAVIYRCESWTIKEGWGLKNWCFQIVVLEMTLESPLDSKEIKPVNPKGINSWIFIERTNAKAEALVLWPRDSKSQLIGKDPDSGKDWGQEEKRVAEDEMVGWNHQFNGYELGQTQF